jgi:hypothetical protein
MQPLAAKRILRLGLAASLVVSSALVTVSKAHAQQEVDPTWYDYRPTQARAQHNPHRRKKTVNQIGRRAVRQRGIRLPKRLV